jgi:hypothetical protein
MDELVQLAGERGDMDELRRLADGGNRDAGEVLTELAGELDDDEGRRAPALLLVMADSGA